MSATTAYAYDANYAPTGFAALSSRALLRLPMFHTPLDDIEVLFV